jgi:hypothetical protein
MHRIEHLLIDGLPIWSYAAGMTPVLQSKIRLVTLSKARVGLLQVAPWLEGAKKDDRRTDKPIPTIEQGTPVARNAISHCGVRMLREAEGRPVACRSASVLSREGVG